MTAQHPADSPTPRSPESSRFRTSQLTKGARQRCKKCLCCNALRRQAATGPFARPDVVQHWTTSRPDSTPPSSIAFLMPTQSPPFRPGVLQADEARDVAGSHRAISAEQGLSSGRRQRNADLRSVISPTPQAAANSVWPLECYYAGKGDASACLWHGFCCKNVFPERLRGRASSRRPNVFDRQRG